MSQQVTPITTRLTEKRTIEGAPAPDPSILVIFGITGDLAQRKLLPALYHLIRDGVLSEHTEIIGVTRREVSIERLMSDVEETLRAESTVYDQASMSRLRSRLNIFKMDLTNDADYAALHAQLDDIELQKGVHMNRVYYLSLPPAVHGEIVERLGRNGLHESCQHNVAETRLLVEKPFGYDDVSAAELIDETSRYFSEKQIFRIDHYLAKETVQNILAFRFNNPIFEAIWDRKNIRSIDIVASETIGIEGRVDFYEQVGALRDLIQSHLLQLLAVVAMERPIDSQLTGEGVRSARLSLLKAIKPFDPRRVYSYAVRGQYQGYTTEVGNVRSLTETFAGVRLSIDNNRWRDVPITLYTGKGLHEKRTEIRVVFASPDSNKTNTLVFSIQPAEGTSITLEVKKPDLNNTPHPVRMDFNYTRSFSDMRHPEGYERVLADALNGDRTLFTTSEEVITTWRIIQPLLDEWAKDGKDMQTYTFGSRGLTLEAPHED